MAAGLENRPPPVPFVPLANSAGLDALVALGGPFGLPENKGAFVTGTSGVIWFNTLLLSPGALSSSGLPFLCNTAPLRRLF